MEAAGMGSHLTSFGGLNRTNEGDTSAFTPAREITKNGAGGFLAHWKQKNEEFQAQMPPPTSMGDVLESLRDDLSQESLDAYFAEYGDKLQQIGKELGLGGEVTGMTLNANGSFTVSASGGQSATFSMLSVRV